MAEDLFVRKGMSASTVFELARQVRRLCGLGNESEFDIVRFLEVEVHRLIPEFYLVIEDDVVMGDNSAYVCDDSKCIVVAERIYNDAVGGLFYAKKILAHEFGHVFMHHDHYMATKHHRFARQQSQVVKTRPFQSAEWQADTFAIGLLIDTTKTPDAHVTDMMRRSKISSAQAKFVLDCIRRSSRSGQTANLKSVRSICAGFEKRFYKKPIAPCLQNQLSLFGSAGA